MKFAILMNLGVPWSRDTAGHLVELGHEVHVIDFTTNKRALGHLLREDEFQAASISQFRSRVSGVYWLSSRFRHNIRYFTAVPSLRRVLHHIQPDVLLTLYSGGFATLAQLSGFRPYVPWAVGSDVLLARGGLKFLLRGALNSADFVLANGNFLAKKTRQLAPRAEVRNLLLGIDLNELRNRSKPERPPLFLSNRGFNPIYQNDFIVEALSLVPEGFHFKFNFASAGPELQKVKALAEQILSPAMTARVEFAGGVSREHMLRLLSQATYFVSMARSDGTATSLLEALAAGVYPIVSDIPQNREWVRPEWKNGILVNPDRPEELARTMASLLNSAPDLDAALDFNRRLVSSHADAARNLQTLADWCASHHDHTAART